MRADKRQQTNEKSPINEPINEKLQKVLARAGYGSRREMETAILTGRINVNGQLAKLGDRVTLTDKILIDGKLFKIAKNSRTRLLMYNKPEGEICTRSDPQGRPTVFDRLPVIKNERWISVGRLDINTSGLLLFTNNGNLAHQLMHPSSNIDREYMVRIHGKVDEAMKQRLLKGVMLEDGHACFTDIVDNQEGQGSNQWFYCVIMEGRNREVRRLWESQQVKVSRLKRVRFGSLFVPSHVRSGQWLELDSDATRDLCETAGIEPPKSEKPLTRAEQEKYRRQLRKLRTGKMRQIHHVKRAR